MGKVLIRNLIREVASSRSALTNKTSVAGHSGPSLVRLDGIRRVQRLTRVELPIGFERRRLDEVYLACAWLTSLALFGGLAWLLTGQRCNCGHSEGALCKVIVSDGTASFSTRSHD